MATSNFTPPQGRIKIMARICQFCAILTTYLAKSNRPLLWSRIKITWPFIAKISSVISNVSWISQFCWMPNPSSIRLFCAMLTSSRICQFCAMWRRILGFCAISKPFLEGIQSIAKIHFHSSQWPIICKYGSKAFQSDRVRDWSFIFQPFWATFVHKPNWLRRV